MEPMTQEAVQVEIFDQAYTLCGGDPDYIVMLAEYVDAKMRSIADEDATADSSQLAVLAAVRIADEYHRSNRDGCEEKMSQGESGEEMRLMTEADRQRTRERRERHYTKRWYKKELLAIVNDESVPANERHEALFALGRVRGYHRRPTGKRRA